MKRFIISVLSVSVFFAGLGGIIEKVGASFKSDEKALAVLQKARQAIGGDAAIGGVRSMTITGRATKTFEVEGAARTEQGELEINFELPNRMSKMLKLGDGTAAGAGQLVDKRLDVVVVRRGDGDAQFKVEEPTAGGEGVRRIVVKKPDGTTEEITDDKVPFVIRQGEGDKIRVRTEIEPAGDLAEKRVFVRKEADALKGAGDFHQNELLRTTLALLLTAPEGLDVSYAYAGEGAVDGAACDIIDAQLAGNSIKLFIDKATSLPRMMSYQGAKPFTIMLKKDPAGAEPNADVKVFTREPLPLEKAEFQVKFSDYRAVGGVQLPFRWTQTIGGKADETVEITAYDINPANIAEKFKEAPTRVFIRKMKDQ